jgi:hypothetical protein
MDVSGTTERAVHVELHRQEQPNHLRVGEQVPCGLAGAELGRPIGHRQRQQQLVGHPGLDGPVAAQEGRQRIDRLVGDTLRAFAVGAEGQIS